MTFPDHDYYKDGFFYRHKDPAWAIRMYGYDTGNKGDLIFETLKKIIDDEDRSEWAYLSLMSCKMLLLDGKRWPDVMNHESDCKGIPCMWWQKIKVKLIKIKTCRFGPQKNITRDPWIMFFVASFLMNRFVNFELKPQWRLWRPNVWRWMKYLRTQDRRYKERYLKHLRPNKREYVERLHYYISLTL